MIPHLETVLVRNQTMSLIFQHWLDWHETEHKEEGVPLDDATHIIAPPYWPSRGQLKAWIENLEAERTLLLQGK